MSLNLNLSSEKDSCVDERRLKCVCGFRPGEECVAFGYMPIRFTRFHIDICVSVS